MKTSLRVSSEVLGNLCGNTKRGKRMMHFLCKVSSTLKVPKFPMTTALQHCLNHPVALHRPAARAGRAPYQCGDREV